MVTYSFHLIFYDAKTNSFLALRLKVQMSVLDLVALLSATQGVTFTMAPREDPGKYQRSPVYKHIVDFD